MADKKISQFDNGGAIQPTDEIATSRAGVNTKVFVGSAAALDAGTNPGELVVFIDDGFSGAAYPAADGSLITNLPSSDLLKVSPTDVAGYLEDKITNGTNVTINKFTDSSGNEYLQISASAGSTSLPDGDYGDIVVSGSGTVFTIDTNSVTTSKILDKNITLAKVEDITSRVLLGRTSSLTGIVEQVPIIDDDTMAAATANNIPTSESVKAYVDSKGGIVSGTAQATTSGTEKDFTGIPSTAKRITVVLSGVSTSGTSPVAVQIGDSGGISSIGYLGTSCINTSSGTVAQAVSTGFQFYLQAQDLAGASRHGSLVLEKIDGNTWVARGIVSLSNIIFINHVSGSKTLSDVLTQVRLTTVGGTDTFDAGTVNISYET